MQENFLSPELLAQRLGDAGVARRAGVWLADPLNAARASATLASVVTGVAGVLDDDEAAAALQRAVVSRVHATAAAPLVAKALEVAIEEGHHKAVVDNVLATAGEYLDEHRDVLRDRLRMESPWWVPEALDDRIFDKVVDGAKRFVSDLSENPDHELRRDVDVRLIALAERLRTDPVLAARVEDRKEQLLAHTDVQAWVASLWAEMKSTVVAGGPRPRLEAAGPHGHRRRPGRGPPARRR